jgi:DNA polymerase-3 subunit delta'
MSVPVPLPWQNPLWAQLAPAREAGRLTHAWLMSGPEGIGKRQFVAAWTARLLCETASGTEVACGRCRSCLQLAAATHPNLMWLRQEVDAKTGKTKRDISVEQLRQLIDRLQLNSHYGQLKIGVVDPADALNASGMNAVLKTIEEPTGDALLILISERPMALAATLRSRCQRVAFATPPTEQSLAWLAAQASAGAVDRALLEAAGNAPLKALDWLRSDQVSERQRWRREWLEIAERGGDPVGLVAAFKERERMALWLADFYRFCGELLKLRLLRSTDSLGGLAQRLPAPALEALSNEALEAQRRLQQNANPQQLAESLMIAWWRWTRVRR